jgi:hypothetical protein
MHWISDRLQLAAAAPRNRECPWRLGRIAENHDADAE